MKIFIYKCFLDICGKNENFKLLYKIKLIIV